MMEKLRIHTHTVFSYIAFIRYIQYTVLCISHTEWIKKKGLFAYGEVIY